MPENANSHQPEPSEAAVLRKFWLRLIPYLLLLFIDSIIDRGNIAIARLQMVDDLHILSELDYSWGASSFFIGYILFQIPSNLVLMRVGARKWIAFLLVTWGLISMGMMWVTGLWSFCGMRVLLGIAEAGFFPGVILYISHWFPARARANAVAMFMTGALIASFVGNPLSASILQYMDGVGGLRGWRWIFLLEGIPAVILGFVTLRFLTDRPEQAHWLTPAERTWLIRELEKDHLNVDNRHSHSLRAAFLNPRVWLLIGIYFCIAVGDNAYGYYIPSFVKTQFPGWSVVQIGLITACPALVAMFGMNLIGRHSDQTGERRWHLACCGFAAALGWAGLAFAPNPWVFLVAMAVALTGVKGMLPTFWTLPASFLTGPAAAGGIALINCMGNLGGMTAPIIVGELKSAYGDFTLGYLFVGGALLIGGLITLQVRIGPKSRTDG
ncbi:MAG: MFS transporter [Planctomycetes bacterium]|nr:MFS transporter [Planctomycetota bacterium]